jgi:hypothetical protein
MEPGVPESFKVLIKELQSLALDVKVLTENREEVEIRIQDDDMGERAQEIGLLMGDEDPRMTQTAAAQREAEAQRATAITGEVSEAEPSEEEEEEEEEIDDSKPIVTGPVGGGMGSADADMQVTGAGIRGGATTDFEDLEIEEEPVEEEEEEEQGYQLEEEDEELSEEASPYGDEEEESDAFHEPEEEF